MSSQRRYDGERTPLLQQNGQPGEPGHTRTVDFDKEGDAGNPRDWPLSRKSIQIVQIFFLALICPMASSMFAPAKAEISASFGTSKQIVLLGQSGFMIGLGTGPLFLAPMSETFGRRPLFVICLAIFTLFQIPTALSPNVATFIAVRTLSGFLGSVGVANGGGSIFDMFEVHQRAVVLGVYLVAPLFGPTLGPLLGGLIVGSLQWRWIFWTTTIVSATVTVVIYFFLYETNATTILLLRKRELEKRYPDRKFEVEGVSELSIPQKISQVITSSHDCASFANILFNRTVPVPSVSSSPNRSS